MFFVIFVQTTVLKCPKRSTELTKFSWKTHGQNSDKLKNQNLLIPGRAFSKTKPRFPFIISISARQESK